MPTILITGASRGIGLEMCKQLHARGDEVIAVCRTATPELRGLGIHVIEDIDVSKPEAVSRLKQEIGDRELDVVVNNAGIMTNEPFDALEYRAMIDQFVVNALGPLMVTEALADNLTEGSKLGIVTSRMGSIGDNTSGGRYGYRASKAAANQIGKSLSEDLKSRGVAVALLHPGMVATDLTGGNGIPPEDAASGLIARLDALSIETTGRFWHAEGQELPW